MINLQGNIKGKCAVITGSTSGIGLGIAQALADQGVHVMINGFGEADHIEALRADLEARSGKAFYSPADMSKPDEIADMIAQAKDLLGGVDILVNNAGFQNVQPVEDFAPEKWDGLLAVILSSSFHTIRAALPDMRARGWGRIINMGSAHAYTASPFKSGYVAAKHGLLGLTKTIALEAAQDNITCNAICPGYVKTPLVEGQIADTAKARGITEEEVVRDVLLAAQWTKKFVTIEQVAGMALFLCSDVAENITGTGLSVDGGWTAA